MKKRNNNWINSHKWEVFLKCLPFTFFLLTGCFEPQEACLDVNAVNFDVTADDPCSDCCTYPTLKLSFRHKIIPPDNQDTSFNLKYNTFYPIPTSITDSFTIERIRFFVSDFQFVAPDGSTTGVTNQLEIEAPSGNVQTLEDNFVKVDRDVFQASTVGTFLAPGRYSGVRFKVGLDSILHETDPMSVPSGHALNVEQDTLIYNNSLGYLSNLVVFNRDTSSMTDSLIVSIQEAVPFQFVLPNVVEIVQGFNVEVVIQIDYLEWFKNLDFSSSTLAEDAEKQIVENLINAFSLFEIKQ